MIAIGLARYDLNMPSTAAGVASGTSSARSPSHPSVSSSGRSCPRREPLRIWDYCSSSDCSSSLAAVHRPTCCPTRPTPLSTSLRWARTWPPSGPWHGYGWNFPALTALAVATTLATGRLARIYRPSAQRGGFVSVDPIHNLVAIDSIAFHSDSYSCRLSTTSRIARSRSSCGYLCDMRAIGLHPHGTKPPDTPG
jgi:hypothetical protein